jgi:hypothetical protein
VEELDDLKILFEAVSSALHAGWNNNIKIHTKIRRLRITIIEIKAYNHWLLLKM